jgi:8-oxo-dGTP diphosphatase
VRRVHVVAGLIENVAGEVLLAERPRGSHLAGLWEFPGGKMEAGEDAHTALVRELKEELGLELLASTPLQEVEYLDHDAGCVLHLQLRRCQHFLGTPLGLDGQALRWVAKPRMHRLRMPPADVPLALALGLPQHYVVTSEPGDRTSDNRDWLKALDLSLAAGAKLFLLRTKNVQLAHMPAFAARVRDRIAHFGAEVLLQDSPELAERWRFGGISLTTRALLRAKKRLVPSTMYQAASCHNMAELAHAAAIACDFVTLAPVQETLTHPDTAGIGWPAFAELAGQFPQLRIFALGGLQPSQLAQAQQAGAWGVAGIRGYFGQVDFASL